MGRSQSSRLKAQSKEEKKRAPQTHTDLYGRGKRGEGRGMMEDGGRKSEVGRGNGECGIVNLRPRKSINQSVTADLAFDPSSGYRQKIRYKQYTSLVASRRRTKIERNPYCKTTAFTWWERLPAANVAAVTCCYRLSWLEAAPIKVDSTSIDLNRKDRATGAASACAAGAIPQIFIRQYSIPVIRVTV